MIDKELLAILACPESHQTLAELEDPALQDLNAKIASGGLKNVAGATVSETLEGGLLREDQSIVYPIRDGIPVLLVEEGIQL